MDELRVLAPTAILGYGFPADSLARGLERAPHVIAVDGGSTDGGPAYLGLEPGIGHDSGRAEAFLTAMKADLRPLLAAATSCEIPLLIGSAGFAGGDLHLMATIAAVREVAEQDNLRFRLAMIRAEVPKSYVKDKLQRGEVRPLGPVPELTSTDIDDAVRIVAQMGVEPFQHALAAGAEVVVAGRSNDPSMFAALPIARGFDRGLALHMAKILECGAIAAEPGSGSDGLIGVLKRDCFELEPLTPERRCTVQSVAAHSLYEKSNPSALFGPGGHVDLTDVRFEQIDDRRVRVSGSRFVPAPYTLKLEGATREGFRTIAIAGIRDPGAIKHVDHLIEAAEAAVRDGHGDDPYTLTFRAYGRDGVMGPLEPRRRDVGHELGLMIDVIADEQSLATRICGLARSVILHAGFPDRRSSAGNIASPISPLDVPVGPAYRFNIHHLVDEPDPLRLFPMDLVEVSP